MSDPVEMPGAVCRIPLRARDGSIRAWALVDEEDAGRVIEAGPWCLDKHGYVVHNQWIKGRTVQTLLHRFVMGYRPGDPGLDHIDRDKLNNRKANLRDATQALNMQNLSPNGLRNNTSGYRGVSWDRSREKWRAQAELNGRKHNLGSFATAEQANERVVAWRREHMPFAEDDR